MAESCESAGRLTVSGLTVVDVDSHASKSSGDFLPYVDRSVRSVFDRISLEEVPWKMFPRRGQRRSSPTTPSPTRSCWNTPAPPTRTTSAG